MNAYNNFDGSLYHQTSFAYTYDEEYLYFNDDNLLVLAWGGGKSDARKYLENDLGWMNLRKCDQRGLFDQIVDNAKHPAARDHILDEMVARNYLNQTQITDCWGELGGRGGGRTQ